jgi:hypothetical protein
MNRRTSCVFRRLVGAFALIGFLSHSTMLSAGEILIDGFSIPSPAEGGFVPPTTLHKHFTGLGGERDILVMRVAGTGTTGSFFVGDGAPSPTGTAEVNSPASAAIQPVFQYDGIDVGDTTAGLVNAEGLGPVDITMGGSNSGFVLSFLSTDGSQTATIDIHSNSNGGPFEMSAVTFEVASSITPFNVFVPFSAFSGVDLTALTSITLTLNSGGSLGADSSLDSFSAFVPEPSSFVLLGIGCMAVCGRRLLRRERKTQPA